MGEITRQDKIEAITGICRYDRKLIDALETLAVDFRTGKEKMPSELLGTIIQGINWTVEVLNQVMDVLAEGENGLEKQMINDALTHYNDAFTSGEEKTIANAIEDYLIPCLEEICAAGERFDA